MHIEDTWHACYDQQLKGVIVPEAFTHPAKMSWSLAQRIMLHLGECWPAVRTIVDPMGGVGVVGIAAAYSGYTAILGELEAENARLAGGCTCDGVTQQDWRRFWAKPRRARVLSMPRYQHWWCPGCRYNLTPPRQSTDPAKGPVDRHIPTTGAHDYHGNIQRHTTRLRQLNKPVPLLFLHDAQHIPLTSAESVVFSPPFAQSQPGKADLSFGERTTKRPDGSTFRAGKSMQADYGSHPAQIGNLRAVVTSPPYGDGCREQGTDHKRSMRGGQNGVVLTRYGSHLAQIGNDRGTDYWSAMAKVYLECARILPPGAPLILVLKGYIKDWKYVDLPMQTAQLLDSCGFEVVHWHNASLVAREAQLGLFGGETRKKRASFFRIQLEKKGAPPIDAEVVVCAVRRA